MVLGTLAPLEWELALLALERNLGWHLGLVDTRDSLLHGLPLPPTSSAPTSAGRSLHPVTLTLQKFEIVLWTGKNVLVKLSYFKAKKKQKKNTNLSACCLVNITGY